MGFLDRYLYSMTLRVEMRVKRRDAEVWMSHKMLPEDLKEGVTLYEQKKTGSQ
ncbi:hypothetical protein HanXRQr2_Chr14g0638871 [Helianthus annuus]|uniref:Uncharacterized protein n=1 Tax=Helianthus annuus TaxID=4232 RepID=A0A9K3E8A0_HELAN|nr:hypothetical protein HanXRQr2_Chr14g0638871 [Helianthus annuus]